MAAATPVVESPWPRPFKLTANPDPRKLTQFQASLFQGPENQPPQVFYSDNYATSENLARSFLNEKVVGFDQEWVYPQNKPQPPLQELVALIQVASEDKIAIFHIGRHRGQTPSQLIAPSLRALIENKAILKTGQSIMGDFYRLNEFFGFTPKGALELSYLHKLIDPNETSYQSSYVKGGLRGLVEAHFPGFTLMKDSKMHKDWSAPLTPMLQLYAAADVYAGIMLYHRMDAKRLEMRPCPPLTACSEDAYEYREHSGPHFPPTKPIYLRPLRPNGMSRPARWFFSMDEDDEVPTNSDDLDTVELITQLVQTRKEVAKELNMRSGDLTTNCALRLIAFARVDTVEECIKLRGLNSSHRLVLAERLVRAVKSFQKNTQQQRERKEESQTVAAQEQVQGGATQKVGAVESTASENSSVPVGEVCQLHTGQTGIAVDDAESEDDNSCQNLSITPDAEEEHSIYRDLSATPDPEETDYGTPFDCDTKPESEANETGSTGAQNTHPVLPASDTHSDSAAGSKDAAVTESAASPPTGPITHIGLSFSMASADLDGEDTKAGAEEERGIDKHELDTPLKRKRSLSPDSGRNCKPLVESS